ncbi:MAG: DUF6599 family protein [Bryobacteraceae bacterium]
MKRFAVLFAAVSLAALGQTPDCSLVSGWTQQGASRSYTGDNLFEYMDGNAEGYLVYGFVAMQGVNCESGGETIVFDVSEMADAESAYGMFTATRDPHGSFERIGMGGQIVPRRAIFAKGKYFVEIGISKDAPDVLRAFCRAIEAKIPGATEPPQILAWFPAEKLAPETVRLVPESVLGLRLLKRGYIAQYDYGKAFIVAETSPETAAEVMRKLRARVGETASVKIADEAFEATDRYLGRLCIFRKGRYIAGFAGLAEGQPALPPSMALAARIP